MKTPLTLILTTVVYLLIGCDSQRGNHGAKGFVTFVSLDQYYENPRLIKLSFFPDSLFELVQTKPDSAYAKNLTALLLYRAVTDSSHGLDTFIDYVDSLGCSVIRYHDPIGWDSVFIDGAPRMVKTIELHRKVDQKFIAVMQWDSAFGIVSAEFGKNMKLFLTDFTVNYPDGRIYREVISSFGRRINQKEYRLFTRDSL